MISLENKKRLIFLDSSSQYVNCDLSGAPDFSNILECDFVGEVCDYNVRLRPCTMAQTPTCPLPPFLTPAPTTTSIPIPPSTTAIPTTSTTSASTTVTTTTIDPNQICENKPAGSRHPQGKGCKQYIYCYMNGGLKGAIYSCQSTTLFDPTLQQCVTGYAAMCTT